MKGKLLIIIPIVIIIILLGIIVYQFSQSQWGSNSMPGINGVPVPKDGQSVICVNGKCTPAQGGNPPKLPPGSSMHGTIQNAP